MLLYDPLVCGSMNGKQCPQIRPDDIAHKPWPNTANDAATQFYQAIDDWYPTWQPEVNHGEEAALQVDWVQVYQ